MSWASRIRDCLLVTIIALLIWIYAEGANVQVFPAQGTLSVPVQVMTATREMVVLEQSPDRIELQFRGAQAQLGRLPEVLSGGLTLRIDQAQVGEHDLVLGDLLRRTGSIEDLHVSTIQISPPTLKVRLDRLVKRQFPVQFQPAEVQLVAGSLQPLPGVSVELPESFLPLLGNDLSKVFLDVEPLVDLKKLPPGVQQSIQGRIRLPAALADRAHVKIEPAAVPLVFTIDKKEDVLVLAAVPVWVLTPPRELETFNVKLHQDDQVLKDVKVSGPAALIQQIREGKTPLIARLRLGADLASLVGKESTGTVAFEAPPQITVEAAQTQVRYTVVRPGQ